MGALSKLRGLSGLAWGLWALAVILLVGTAVHVAFVSPAADVAEIFAYFAAYIGFCTVGALIVSRTPRHGLGWVFLGVGGVPAVHAAARFYARYAHDQGLDWLGVTAMAWLASWTFLPSLVLLLVFTPLLFPDGRLPAGRSRWLGRAGAGLIILAITQAVRPGALHIGDLEPLRLHNPVGIPLLGPAFAVLDAVIFPLIMAASLAALAGLGIRYRSGTVVQRRQIKWVVLAFGALIMGVLVDDIVLDALGVPWGPGRTVFYAAVLSLGLVGIPAAAGVAVLRHRLFDIDLILNRTVVYAVLAASVTGLYLLLVVGVGRLVGTVDDAGRGLALLATGVAAVTFQPLRERVQRSVNRLMYGDRDDPYAALRRMSTHLAAASAPDTVLPGVAASLAQGLRLSGVALEVRDGEGYRRADAYGEVTAEAVVVPLRYRGWDVGRLLACGDRLRPLSGRERRVLTDLAAQIAVAVHAVELAADLQRAREGLVLTREEERRRLRRDLHDGLGSVLTGVVLKLQATRHVVTMDPQRAAGMIDELITEGQGALNDIRRLVYGLRPPALDELGLVGALKAEADRVTTTQVDLQLPETMPSLSAAVEVAAYRIIQEALTNVERHAAASRCVVHVAANGSLDIHVSDDGRGLADGSHPGVGLLSMRERATELGGSVDLTPSPLGGTSVRVQLPILTP